MSLFSLLVHITRATFYAVYCTIDSVTFYSLHVKHKEDGHGSTCILHQEVWVCKSTS